ncbi:hypothetical protein Pmani_006048 [Petrolisthes manimaculis]|uniref:Nucleolar and spindle-associated protein 1 n=1 Tax=Petrolisthes manimaculis TaxID=1843537 RepID=A0AAE1UGX4_9EUCA|nr:hypothetical protein Pmani_006048 [Petrolisthes manimaculis]
METEVYTEEDLRGHKYTELLKIAKTLGIKSRRMKAEKLIETILQHQEELSLQREAEAVASEVASAAEVTSDKDGGPTNPTQSEDDEELLTDVTCPDILLAEDIATKDELPQAEQEVTCMNPEQGENVTVRGRRKRRRNGTYEVAKEEEQNTVGDAMSRPKRRKTSTFDVPKKDEQTPANTLDADDMTVGTESTVEKTLENPKRHKTSTFDVIEDGSPTATEPKCPPSIIKSTSEDDASQQQQRRTSTFDIAKEDEPTPEQRRTSTYDIAKEDEPTPKQRRTSTFDIAKEDEPTPKQRRTSTFDIAKEDEPTPKQRRTSTFDIAKEDEPTPAKSQLNVDITKTEQNSSELNLLVETLNRRSSGSAKSSVSASRKSVRNKAGVVENEKIDKPPAKTPRRVILNTSKIMSVSKQTQEKISTPASVRRSQAGMAVDVNRKSTGMPRGTKIVKPIFTVGRKDTTNKSSSGESSTKVARFVSSARKVPNFAKIHEQAFKRMEALDDYVDKKRKMTGSSMKKPQVAPEKVFQPSVTSVKNLQFNFVSSRSPNRVPVFSKPKTPGTENSKVKSRESVSAKKSTASILNVQARKSTVALRSTNYPEKSTSATLRKSRGSALKSSSTFGKPTNAPKQSPATLKKPGVPTRKSPRTTSASTTSHLKSPQVTQHLKENLIPAHPPLESQPSAESKAGEAKHTSKIPKSKSSYVPHKGPLRPYGNREALKKLAEKKPAVKSSREIRENQKRILKGVRFNKRFELQMANRGINL